MEINKILQSKTPVVNPGDRTPYTFKQWYDSTTGIIPGQEYRLYTDYLIEWYKQYNLLVQDSKILVKLKYLSLLKQLQLFFSASELENWYNRINIENEKELLLAIPYFARKLKEIAFYYFRLRDKVKNSRIRHGLAGTEIGLAQQIRELLLENYTQNNITIPAAIWQKVPALSSLSTDIHVVVEDLYDTHSYFDHSYSLPASAYYDINDTRVQNFILSRNLALSSTEWLYKLGTLVFSLCSEDTNLQELHQQLVRQTAGNNLFTTQLYTVSTDVDIFNISIEQGTNSFLWPQGNYSTIANTFPRYEPIALSSDAIKNIGIPGDSIFIRTKQGIEGAWKFNKTVDVVNQDLQAKFNADKNTIFKFPFPGYGISAEDISWTGYSFKTDIRYNYLDDEVKRAISQEYWNTDTSLSSVQTIKINDTTLAEQGAHSATAYVNADKIRIRKNSPTYESQSYSGDIDEAWLYRMNETSISIAKGTKSTILWPYKKLTDPNTEEIPITNFYEVCNPLSLTSINIDYSTGSSEFGKGDVIYRINAPDDQIIDATECAWLSAPPYFNPTLQLSGTRQSSLNCAFSAGGFTRFIWEGPNNTDVNIVFKPVNHYSNCEYLKITNPTIDDFTKCTCKQVYFTPFGHPGGYFTDYNQQTDFIVEDNFTPLPFDLNSWRDNTGTGFAESSAFCWFKTTNSVGWNSGRWNSGSTLTNNNYYLKRGKSYVYYRATSRKSDSKYPEYIARYKYNQYPGIWLKGIKNGDQWNGTTQPSDMIIYPGDYLIYDRTPSMYFTLTGETVTPILSGTKKYSIWSNYDFISIPNNNNSENASPIQVTVAFPSDNYVPAPTGSQYPPAGAFNKILEYIAWELTTPDNQSIIYYNTPTFTFTPTLTGLYTTSLTALTGRLDGDLGQDGFYYTSIIPPITATVLYNRQPALTATSSEVPGFTLRVPLKGWDYNINDFNPTSIHANVGAKPYWATFKTDAKNINVPAVTDNYNLITIPDISEIEFSGGEHVEYIRNYNTDLVWTQPLTLLNTVDENYWATLQINVSGLSNKDLFISENNTYIVQLSTPSNLLIKNYIENEPTEIVYNSSANFVWSITATPAIETVTINSTPPYSLYEALLPWHNLLNQNNPSLAIFPTVEALSSLGQIGGFFTPEYHGVTKYLNKDYTYTLDVTSSALTSVYSDPDKNINIRGLSKQDLITPYTFTDNNTWLKEPPISSNIAGTINKNIFKKYQKFIPYQSTYETNPTKTIGLVLPTSQQTPWNGDKNTQWGDPENYPTSYTGVINVSSWVESQVLKNNNLFVDSWGFDIYGNQYGLYKNYNNTAFSNQQNIPGEIWIRNNKQRVLPGYIGLSSVFDTFRNTNLQHLLTGSNIYNMNVFYNTLYIETSSVIFLEKINYDYTTNNIFSISDDARFISLMTPVTTTLIRELNNQTSTDYAIPGDTWFNPSGGIVLFSTVNLSGYNVVPNLFEYNMLLGTLQKVFPTTQRDNFKLSRLNSLQLKQVLKPRLSYNKNIKQYTFTIPGISETNEDYIIEIKLNNITYDSYSITTYKPEVEILPPTVNYSLLYNLTAGETFAIQITSTPVGATFNEVSLPSWTTLTTNGLFTGIVPYDISGSVFATFTVNNDYGTTYQILTLNIL